MQVRVYAPLKVVRRLQLCLQNVLDSVCVRLVLIVADCGNVMFVQLLGVPMEKLCVL